MAGMTPSTPTPIATTSAASQPIASFDLVVLDTPEPRRLADFYCALLGWKIVGQEDDWVTIRGDAGAGMAFQLAPDLIPPTWPDSTVPQQFHLDVNVPDLELAEQQVLAVGARLTGEPKQPSGFRAYLDPSGHPLCLCLEKN